MKYHTYFFILLTILFSCEDKSLYLFQIHKSPDGKFELKVFYTDPPIYGPHDICFTVLDLKTSIETDKDCYELNNDGANLSDTNIQIDWVNNQTAQIILDGEQQEADTLILNMN